MEDYFTLFGLPKSFALKESDIHQRYVQLQKLVHPDRLVGKSAAERAAAVSLSMRVNDAYDTLKSPLLRAEYLLDLRGIYVNSDDDTQPPSQALLMEVLELREQLAEADSGIALKQVMDDIKASMQRVIVELEGAFAADQCSRAAELTMRLKYLGKSLEEAHTLFYRFKSASAHEHTHH